MDKDRIEVGDRVQISFTTPGGNMLGIVLYTPQASGDAWHIRCDDGTLSYVQQYETMGLISKARP